MSGSFSSFPELSLLEPEEPLWFSVNFAYFFLFVYEASFLFFSFFLSKSKQHLVSNISAGYNKVKGKGKSPLSTPLTHTGAVKVQLDSFLTSVQDGGQRSTPSPVAFPLRKLIKYTKNRQGQMTPRAGLAAVDGAANFCPNRI